jgi:hypothetical protein
MNLNNLNTVLHGRKVCVDIYDGAGGIRVGSCRKVLQGIAK